MKKMKLIYEGKAKQVYATDNPNMVIQHFKDDATAFDGKKRGQILGKGAINNQLSALLFLALEEAGIPTHFVELLGARDMLVKKLSIVPVEVVVRNIAAGGLSAKLGIPEGTPLKKTVIEFSLKSDALHDPPINHYHIAALGLTSPQRLALIEKYALEINKVLKIFFKKININVIDFKLEFGIHKGKLMLGDEISPDTCRFWDAKTGHKLDKDRFRRDMGGAEEAYQEVWRRVQGMVKKELAINER